MYNFCRIFDPDFVYAAMLPFGGELLMLVWMPFFGTTMTTQALGMLSFLAVLSAAVVFLFRSWRFSWTETFFWAGSILLVFSCSDKMREMFWGHVIYYSLYVVFTCLGFGLVARLVNGERVCSKKNCVLLGILGLLSFLVAFDGLQVVFIWTCPLVASVFLVRWLDLKKTFIVRENRDAGILLATVVVGTLLGYLTLVVVRNGQLAGYANAWYGITTTDKWIEHLQNIPVHWITLLGFQVPGAGIATIDLAEILGTLGFALFLAFFPFVSLFVYGKTKDETYRAFVLQHFILSVLLVLGVVFGSLGAANWRWIPVVASGLLLTIYTLHVLAREMNGIRVAFVVAPFILVFGLLNAREIWKMPADYGRENTLHLLATDLENLGLEYGYADFWTSQAVTVLSDGNVKVRSITVSSANGIDPYYYQTKFSWYADQEGIDTYFIILSSSANAQFRLSEDYDTVADSIVETYTLEGYVVLVLDANPF
jgi:hypothetical protein